MRKDALRKLLSEHTSLIAKFISTIIDEHFHNIPEHGNIAFESITALLHQNGLELNARFKSSTQQQPDNQAFFLLVTGKSQHEAREYKTAPKQNDSPLCQMIEDIITTKMSPFLDDKSLANLSSCSSTLYQHMLSRDVWSEKLLKIGCLKNPTEFLIKNHLVENVKNLYRNVLRINRIGRYELSLWDMLCLSGEPHAIHYGIKQGLITTTNNWSHNALHYAALSGSISAITAILENTRTPVHYVDTIGLSAIHYAALSGSKLTLQYVTDVLRIPANLVNLYGASVLHYAACSGSIAAITYVTNTLKIPASITDRFGITVLHYAALSGNTEMIKYALEVLKLPPESTSKHHINILHYAALSGSAKAVRYFREVCHLRKLRIEPMDKDQNGHDAFWYANNSDYPDEVNAALRAPQREQLKPPSNSPPFPANAANPFF